MNFSEDISLYCALYRVIYTIVLKKKFPFKICSRKHSADVGIWGRRN